MGQPSPSPGRTDPAEVSPPIYQEVCKDLKVDPLKPNRLSKQIDSLSEKIKAKIGALHELATGEG